MFEKHLVLSILFFSIAICSFAQPNFIIIVLDDQGWTGTSVQMNPNLAGAKSDYYLTPQLEKLASQGMTFSQGYAPAPKCSPSRCSILTGRSTARNSFTSTDNSITPDQILIEASTETSLNGNDITYAEWLKSTGLGYRTAHFGKWHLGTATTSTPSENGFDFSDGSTTNNDGDNAGDVAQSDPKKMFELTEKSLSFIENAAMDKVPFAIQLSHYAVHSKVEARQETIDLYNDANLRPKGTLHDNAEYGAMTEDTDTAIGLLLDKIQQLGLTENTFIFFISDNGGQLNLSDNSPLSFGKTFLYEGGIRVPFIVSGPSIPRGSYNDTPIVGYDIFPTIAALTGNDTSLPENIDGQSIMPLLLETSFERTAPLFFHSPHYDNNRSKKPRSAAIKGNLKLLVDYESGINQLFDLSNDIGETTDISDENIEIKKELLLELRNHLKKVNANMPKLDATHAHFSGNGVDIDDDGLDDEWEFRELLSYTLGPEDDPDNDGYNNSEEFENNTDPLIADDEETEALRLDHEILLIYPNPSTNRLKIELGSGLTPETIESIEICDNRGRIVMITESFMKEINLEHLAKGSYYLKIKTTKEIITKKVLLQ